MTNKAKKELHEVTRRAYAAEADMKACIAAKGDALSQKMGYGDLDGLNAIHRYLIDKYHWLPRDVRALTVDELQMLIEGVDLG